MKKVEVSLYEYKELSDKAKEKARAWFTTDYPCHDWWDPIYEDAKEMAKLLGIEIDDIYFSGFYSHGDGACFKGTFRPEDVKTVEEFLENYPEEKTVLGLYERICKVKCPEDCRVNISVSGHHSHSHTMSISFTEEMEREEERELLSCVRAFADWIYRTLEKEYEYLLSDEAVEESITANEYLFLEDGSRCTLGDRRWPITR